MTVKYLSTLLTFSLMTIAGEGVEEKEPLPKLQLHLRSLDAAPEIQPPSKPIPIHPLDPEKIKDYLKQLPQPTAPAQVEAFNLPRKTRPPSRSAQTIPLDFSEQAEERPEPDLDGSLQVLRISPQGETEFTRHLSITFSQPMVAMGATRQLPIRLEPAIELKHRWAGTQTLILEHPDGFPMATSYQLTIPAGIKSLSGQELGQDISVNFTTPSVEIIDIYPSPKEPISSYQSFALFFNQPVAADEISKHLEMFYESQPLGFDVIDPSEAHDWELDEKLEGFPKTHVMILEPRADLHENAHVKIVSKGNLPSRQGPNSKGGKQSFSFGKPSIFRVDENTNDQKPPHTPWRIYLSQPLADDFDPAWVHVEPPIANMKIRDLGDLIEIEGDKEYGTYQITLSPEIPARTGQRLGQTPPITFEVVPSPSVVQEPNRQRMLVLAPGDQHFPIATKNVSRIKVELYKVTPQDWPVWEKISSQERKRTLLHYTKAMIKPEDLIKIPGTLVYSKIIELSHPKETLTLDFIDLEPALKNDTGQVIVCVEVLESLRPSRDYRVVQWVQKTNLSLEVASRGQTFQGSVRHLLSGQPIERVALTTMNETGDILQKGLSDHQGRWNWNLDPKHLPNLFTAQLGEDLVLLTDVVTNDSTKEDDPQTIWYIEDVQRQYRPGETVFIKGWVRETTASKNLTSLKPGTTIHMEVQDNNQEFIESQDLQIGSNGDFDTRLILPPNIPLGSCYFRFTNTTNDDTGVHEIWIRNFRTPDCEVTLTPPLGPSFLNEPVQVSARAAYFTGDPLTKAPADWEVNLERARYRPPNQDFVFSFDPNHGSMLEEDSSNLEEAHKGQTDSKGVSILDVSLVGDLPQQPRALSIRTDVKDPSYQEYSGYTKILMHPAAHYVGLRSEKYITHLGEPLQLEAVVCDLAGKPIKGSRIYLETNLATWQKNDGQWQRVLEPGESLETESSQDPVPIALQPDRPGTWVITARIQDDEGRWNQTEFERWVSGETAGSTRKKQTLDLSLNKDTYIPGDTAELLIIAPFPNGHGTLSLEGTEILPIPFQMKGDSHRLTFPIQKNHAPNIEIHVSVYGQHEGQPAYGDQSKYIDVEPVHKRLEMTVQPSLEVLAPGQETELQVLVEGSNGSPVKGADVCVFVIDEAVLAMTRHEYMDPLEEFYPSRYSRTHRNHLHDYLRFGPWDPAQFRSLLEVSYSSMSSSYESIWEVGIPDRPAGGQENKLFVRDKFTPVAAWFPSATSNASGIARVKFSMPGNLTRYRIVAIAAAGDDRFGKVESQMTTRLPLMVRPSAPRFLNYGDHFQMPVTIQNQSDQPMKVDLVARVDNGILSQGQGRRVNLPAKEQTQIFLPIETLQPGTLKFEVAVFSDQGTDAASLEIPVYTPATTESFATYGSLEEGDQLQEVRLPDDAIRDFGGLQITTSTTAASALADAFAFLRDEPYPSTETRASRLLAMVSLADLAETFDAELDPQQRAQIIQTDITKLLEMASDGGFGYWRGMNASPYLTVHATHALLQVRAAGWDVDENPCESGTCVLESCLAYLRNIFQFTEAYPQIAREETIAYALQVLDFAGENITNELDQFLAETPLAEASPATLARLLTLTDERETIIRILNNQIEETAGTANLTSRSGSYHTLQSQARDQALVLAALIQAEPNHSLIAKLVAGLMASSKKGRWASTHENAFAILALNEYVQQYESEAPALNAQVWLDDHLALEQGYFQRTTDRHQMQIPMNWLKQGANRREFLVRKDGEGRLYYRLGMAYAPQSLQQGATSRGFTVARTYEAIDDPQDVWQDDAGGWHVKAGARINIILDLVLDGQRHHVALTDPLPAGFESIPLNGNQPRDYILPDWRHWHDHREMRDNRTVVMASGLEPGTYQFRYSARATTPGTFILPPAHAEEVYAPETFGRSHSERVIISD